MPVTTRTIISIMFLVGNPELNLHLSLAIPVGGTTQGEFPPNPRDSRFLTAPFGAPGFGGETTNPWPMKNMRCSSHGLDRFWTHRDDRG